MKRKAVVLFSGGLDSTTVLYYALAKNYECHCLIFDYGQKHKKEINAAVNTAKKLKIKYYVIDIKIPWEKSSLVNKSNVIPEHKTIKKNYIPTTYVPGRNTLFLSYALSYAETVKAKAVFIGVNAVDFSSYPDCTPEYLAAVKNLMKSLKNKIKICAPLENMSKAEIIKAGVKLKVPYVNTWTCYGGMQKPCGKCDSCKLRAKGFKEAGINDPAIK